GRQCCPRVAHNWDVDAHVTADLGWVDVDVYDARARSKGGRAAGHSIIEAATHVEQYIAFLQRTIHVHPAVHAGHAQTERVMLGERAFAVQRGDDRDAGFLRQLHQL